MADEQGKLASEKLCNEDEEKESDELDDYDMDEQFESKVTEEQTKVLQGLEEFSNNLYNVLAKNEGNIFFSPLSIHAILSLAAQGSEGQTREALSEVLTVSDMRVAAEGYKTIMEYLNSVPDVTVLLANKIFLSNRYKLREAYKTVATQNFSAEVQTLDFEQPEDAAKSINTWVEEKTNKKIKNVVDSTSLNGNMSSILVNTIYFKGRWAFPFKARKTVTDKFYLNDNDTVDVQMMHMKKDDMGFKKIADAKVLEFPYLNMDLNLIIILPDKRNGISELEKRLAEIYLDTKYMCRQEVHIYLPKFKIEQTIDFKETLTEMGLGDIFTAAANFSDMIDSPEPLCVSEVVQKTFFEVNEVGSEGAAADAMRLLMLCAPPPPEEFRADHPFIIILTAQSEGARHILFMGRISHPNEDSPTPQKKSILKKIQLNKRLAKSHCQTL